MTLEETAGGTTGENRRQRGSVRDLLKPSIMVPLIILGGGASALLASAGSEANEEYLMRAGIAVGAITALYAFGGTVYNIFYGGRS